MQVALFYRTTTHLITRNSKPRISFVAAAVLLAASLCTGCAIPFGASKECEPCGEPVHNGASCNAHPGLDCILWPGHECYCSWICRNCLFGTYSPCRLCSGAVNFCAKNEAVGPPDIQAPGRFHPVPTHPVFAPVQDGLPGPDQ